ncbi:hypothetical protein B0H17DRAFT_1160264 [Mycena rosella]|uniref:DUF6570 domain-containing protein n=1 Tax=Mycena rosella TaxID=1033263 RepID=A0AAD7DF36_MYCRO|nr:hypothetical protein B0H17DRAFT_1160264 [Mycena rosella]
MIARCRSKCWIIQLKEENQHLVLQSTQRGIKGHVIIYPLQLSKVANILPPLIEEITTPVCVLFVGSSVPTPEWLREHAKPLAVNATRVRNTLRCLKQHNPLYRDILINEECLQHLEENPILIICPASSNKLRAAALRYVQKREGGYVQVPHDHEPENEFRQDSLLFPLIYPTLFPYGIGGPNDLKRAVSLFLNDM